MKSSEDLQLGWAGVKPVEGKAFTMEALPGLVPGEVK